MRDYPSYCVALKPVDFFLPSEEVDEEAVHRLAAAITRAGMWTTPIPVDRETGIIMDGNHRARAAVLLGLHYLPCVLLAIGTREWSSPTGAAVSHFASTASSARSCCTRSAFHTKRPGIFLRQRYPRPRFNWAC
ncbi:ParB N-terminal domain-containing protein [Vogesella indigofera]|uniref:ParB N-terminal domain-containing protein n=1 Tax=Vogesella indigofera TaxID=45465 RepID=UPI00234EEB27|nr:ParB N-terminal domain-containing protein [Vogesella indigofera]MDC7707166.1 ParB N-terminal domain-containing protein [Vogesella indigofera]